MHDVEGYTHLEIGVALGIQEGTSKAQLSRARAKLRRFHEHHTLDRRGRRQAVHDLFQVRRAAGAPAPRQRPAPGFDSDPDLLPASEMNQ